MTGSERHWHDEFPPGAADPPDPVSRRQFLAVMGAGLAAGLLLASLISRPKGEQGR